MGHGLCAKINLWGLAGAQGGGSLRTSELVTEHQWTGQTQELQQGLLGLQTQQLPARGGWCWGMERFIWATAGKVSEVPGTAQEPRPGISWVWA